MPPVAALTTCLLPKLPPAYSPLPLAHPSPRPRPRCHLLTPHCHLLPPSPRCHPLHPLAATSLLPSAAISLPPLPPTYSPPPAAYSPPRTQTHPSPAAAAGRSPLWLWVMCWVGCGPTCSSPPPSTAPGPTFTWPPRPRWKALPANTGQTTSEGGGWDGGRRVSEGCPK